MSVTARVSGAQKVDFPLTFNQIIGYQPGDGRGRSRKGVYEHKSGKKLLVVFSRDVPLVDTDATTSGLTRSGMAMVDIESGVMRPVRCDRSEDGEPAWRKFAGTIELSFKGQSGQGQSAE
jgi:hypothetical protein